MGATYGIQRLKLLLSAWAALVHCDLEMRGLDVEKLLRMSQSASGLERTVSFLVLTALTDQEGRTRLFDQGVSDAITKSFYTADLIARIGLHLKLVQAQRELMAENAELNQLLRTVALTGLANRREVGDPVLVNSKRSQRYEIPFAEAIADIDQSKSVNDDHGHPVGDIVLRRVAETIKDIVRETDCGLAS